MSEIETLDDIVERLRNLGHEVERRDARIGIESEWPTERPFRFYPLPHVQVTVTCVYGGGGVLYQVEHMTSRAGVRAIRDTSAIVRRVARRLFDELEWSEKTGPWLGRWR